MSASETSSPSVLPPKPVSNNNVDSTDGLDYIDFSGCPNTWTDCPSCDSGAIPTPMPRIPAMRLPCPADLQMLFMSPAAQTQAFWLDMNAMTCSHRADRTRLLVAWEQRRAGLELESSQDTDDETLEEEWPEIRDEIVVAVAPEPNGHADLGNQPNRFTPPPSTTSSGLFSPTSPSRFSLPTPANSPGAPAPSSYGLREASLQGTAEDAENVAFRCLGFPTRPCMEKRCRTECCGRSLEDFCGAPLDCFCPERFEAVAQMWLVLGLPLLGATHSRRGSRRDQPTR